MSDAVILAVTAAISSILMGTVVVGVGVWADGRRKRADATVAAGLNDQNELTKVRAEYRERIERLEKRLDDKDTELRGLSKELSDARVIIAQQAARIADLESEIAQLQQEHAARRARDHQVEPHS